MYSKSIIADGNDSVRVSWVAGMRFDAILCPSVSPVSSVLDFNRRSPHRRREHLKLQHSRGARTHNERIGDVDLLIHKSILNEPRTRNKLHSFLAIGKRTIYISRGVKIFCLILFQFQFLICIGGARLRGHRSHVTERLIIFDRARRREAALTICFAPFFALALAQHIFM